MAKRVVVLIIYLKSGLRDKTSLLTYRTGFVALLAQLYGSEIVDSTICLSSWFPPNQISQTNVSIVLAESEILTSTIVPVVTLECVIVYVIYAV